MSLAHIINVVKANLMTSTQRYLEFARLTVAATLLSYLQDGASQS